MWIGKKYFDENVWKLNCTDKWNEALSLMLSQSNIFDINLQWFLILPTVSRTCQL